MSFFYMENIIIIYYTLYIKKIQHFERIKVQNEAKNEQILNYFFRAFDSKRIMV